jgi:TetR/AcrR family transcriptional repressor of mexJK operon
MTPRVRPYPATKIADLSDTARCILTAAYAEFTTAGYCGATMENIKWASRAAKSTIYRHFQTKGILFCAAVEWKLEEALSAIDKFNIKDAELGPYLSEFGLTFLKQTLSEAGLDALRLVSAESERFPKLGRAFYRLGPKRVAEVLETRLAAAHARKEIHAPIPAVAAEHFIGMVRGDLHLRMLLGEKAPSEVELTRCVSAAVTAFLTAYASGGKHCTQ